MKTYSYFALSLLLLSLLSLCKAKAQTDTNQRMDLVAGVLLDSITSVYDFPNSETVCIKTLEVGKRVKSYEEKNCVEFVHAVFEDLFPEMLDQNFKDMVYINDLGGLSLNEALSRNTDQIRGVQWALESYGIGYAVERDSVMAGDFVQYWYKRKNGAWGGHVAVVMEVNQDGTLNLYSSNKSTGGPDYLRNYKLRSNAYFARLYPKETLSVVLKSRSNTKDTSEEPKSR